MWAFRTVLARRPRDAEVALLTSLYKQELARLSKDAVAARRLIGTQAVPKDASAAELAAWFFVANTLLNLDETITKG